MNKQKNYSAIYFKLTLLAIIFSNINLLQAQDAAERIQQNVAIARKAYEEGNRNKTQLIAEGKWNMKQMPGLIKFRPPIVALLGNYDYEYFKILSVPAHADPNWPALSFVCNQNLTSQGQTGTTFTYLEPTNKYVNNPTANVVAASSGVIVVKQDGIDDNQCLNNSNTGNYIAIEHSNGWRTYYYQLHINSLTNKPIGSFVNEGERIGNPGLFDGNGVAHSGIGTFVFELRDQNNIVVDPFDTGLYCFGGGVSLWQDSAYMYWKVIEKRMMNLKVTKYNSYTVEGCGYHAKKYSQHFNQGDFITVWYYQNWMSYSDSVLMNVYNPLGVPIVNPFGRKTSNLISYANGQTGENLLLPNGGLMIPGTYTLVAQLYTDYDSYASVKQTAVTYFTVGCISDYTLSSTVNGEYGKIAGNNIYSSQTCNSGSRVKYIAGNEIILQPGFNAYNGSTVMIYNEQCVAAPRFENPEDNSNDVSQILIAPNPASNFITVNLTNTDSKIVFKIYTTTLQLVKTINANSGGETTISVNDLSPGIYFIDAQSDNQHWRQKFIINR